MITLNKRRVPFSRRCRSCVISAVMFLYRLTSRDSARFSRSGLSFRSFLLHAKSLWGSLRFISHNTISLALTSSSLPVTASPSLSN